jgi:hypothetical protein
VHVGGKLLLTPTPEQIEEELNEFAATNSNGEVSRDFKRNMAKETWAQVLQSRICLKKLILTD